MTVEKAFPEIRIKDGWLLRENASQYLHELWGDGTPLVDDEWMARRVADYQAAWQGHEEKILKGLYRLTGLTYLQNIIDVYIAPWFSAFSDPMVIGVMREPDEFVDVLTHELIHRLLTDNTNLRPDTDLIENWQKLFGKKHSFTTLVHIPVHAVHKAVYLDVLKDPRRLERDKRFDALSEAEDYLKSWAYVDETGYGVIIEKLKKDFVYGH